ncbi:T9SS type A sorting domain-containing protein [Spirosoma luteum]|uniref:T9SS type A sorting domain-containing protein n=1 Tax=Spirosoma luteum TaxID=431553 RepID=UPI00036C9AC5|nr:T9SS type A sorting domain-containing protein [Spirosoma luteum]
MKKHYLHLTHRVLLPLLWACLFLNQTTFAQSIPDAQWARVGDRLVITNDGNIATSGELSPGPEGVRPRQVVKYDLQGNVLWQSGVLAGQSYLGGRLPPEFCPCIGGYVIIDNILHMNPAPDGGIRLTGREYKGSGVITSLNAAGQQGLRDYGGGSDAMIATPDGGNLYVNTVREFVSSGVEKTVVSVEKKGSTSWTTKLSYPSSAPDIGLTKANAAISTPDGGYLIAGYYNPGGDESPFSGWMAKLDGEGNLSWQKLISPGPLTTSFPSKGDISSVSNITDAIISADGTGYALGGYGRAYPNSDATVLVEIDANGNSRAGRSKAILLGFNKAYLTVYTAGNGKKYYAFGSTSTQGRADPLILLVDPTTVSSVTSRTFPGPGQSRLTDITTAGDGSLVYVTDNNQLVKLQPEAPTQPPTSALALTAPTYNCATGAITFNTSGGDGSPVEYMAPGITGWTTNPNQILDGCARTCADTPPFLISARQSGNVVTYTWSRQTYCTNPPPPPPPVTPPPTGGSLALLAPTYNCATGAFTFNTSGGNGSAIEYQAAGITGWTTNPNQFVDRESRTALDVQPFTLMARQNGVTVTYVWDLRAYCNGTPPPPPPVTPPPTGGSLALLAPTYNCATGAFTFNTSGGNGSAIEYQAAGITGWTTNPNQFVDRESRTALDVQPFTLMARQNGVTVTYVWDLKAACGRARTAALPEPGTQLRVRVLGNPVAGQTAEVEITGAGQQALQLNLVDLQGRVLHQQRIQQPESTQRVRVPLGEGSGLFLLNVSTSTQHQQVKLIKP